METDEWMKDIHPPISKWSQMAGRLAATVRSPPSHMLSANAVYTVQCTHISPHWKRPGQLCCAYDVRALPEYIQLLDSVCVCSAVARTKETRSRCNTSEWTKQYRNPISTFPIQQHKRCAAHTKCNSIQATLILHDCTRPYECINDLIAIGFGSYVFLVVPLCVRPAQQCGKQWRMTGGKRGEEWETRNEKKKKRQQRHCAFYKSIIYVSTGMTDPIPAGHM